MRAKRILWLLNHDTLSKFELPLIRDLGFEIFTPKSALKEIFQASGSVTYEYDSTLTIPKKDLELLNEYDFFSTFKMPLKIKKILNTHFETAITYTDTSFLILRKLIHNFEGNILFRAFGVGPSNFKNYTDLINYYFEENDKLKLKQIGSRFWFSQCYSNISEIEDQFYKENSVYMPLGLPSDFYEIENQWTGEMDKVLFFCTRIKYIPESEKVFNDFKRDFKGFDFLVAGNQPIPVDDDRVLGFLERDELNELYKQCKVMYYHSTHPRHLHYHPLEAMIAGMPVVYMDGGLLSVLAAGKRQSGSCKSISEARKKVQRILDGDKELIENIRQDQEAILHKFSYQYNFDQWKQNFLPIVEKGAPFDINKVVSLAIFNSDRHSIQHKYDYIEVVNTIRKSLRSINPANKIVYNVLPNHYDLEKDFKVLEENNIMVREFDFQDISSKGMNDSLELMFKQELAWHETYIHPVDNAQNFEESDYWLFLQDSIDKPIAPIKPFGIYVENLGDRYYETISGVRITNLKSASFIITSSNATKTDLVKHLGINEGKIYVIPVLYSIPNINDQISLQQDYVLIEVEWSNPDYIKDILGDINDYFELYKHDQKIIININDCVKEEIVDKLIEMKKDIQKSTYLKNNVRIYSNLGLNEYNALYAHSKRVIIPRNIKNINFKLAKAAYFKKPVIVNDFPFYKEFEKIGVILEYKNFQLKENILFETLSDIIEIHPSNIEFKSITQKDIDILMQLWREIV